MKRLWQFAVCFFLFTTLAMGQAARTATLVGTVTDPTGALIPAAKVTVRNTETGFVSNGVTNAEGGYYIPFLAVGNYQLTVEAAGFKSYVQRGIDLGAGEVPRIDVKMEVGATTESVQVTVSAPLLATETSQVSQTMEARLLADLPIHQANVVRVLYYVAGVNAGSSILGQSVNNMGFTLDGISGKQSLVAAANSTNDTTQPALDSLAEVKVYTTGAPAELGHAAGGILAMTFKSGTNALHGTLEDDYTSSRMTHRGFLQQGTLNYPMNYHQAQATVSGPVVLPKIYNGRNRTFFLFGWAIHHETSREPQTGTVPDLNMLSGDFSFSQTAAGGYPIYDPKSIRQSGTTWTADVFPGMRVPMSRFDPVVVNFLALKPWKEPNNTGGTTYSRTGPSNNWIGETRYGSRRSRFDYKVDHQISPVNKFFFRVSWNRHRQPWGRNQFSVNNLLLESSLYGLGRPSPKDQTNWAFADYHTFSPTLMNELRMGYARRMSTVNPPTLGAGWAEKLGIPNVGPESFPSFGLYNIGPGGFSQANDEELTFQNNTTKLFSRLSVKFGYEVIRIRQNNVDAVLPSGSYSFGTGGTALPYTPNTGNTFASFVLGAVSSATYTQQIWNRLPRWWSHAAYMQTDWKARRNLTVNLGLRYTLETPFKDKWDHQSQFDPAVADPLTGRMGAITHPKGALYKTDKNNFQPRLGLSFNFRRNMVFRGSFGVLTQDLLPSAGFQDYTATAVVQQVTGDPRPAFFLSQGPPNRNFILNADGTSQFLGTNYSSRGATFIDSNLRVPYIMNWSGGIQFQLSPVWLLELLYQGAGAVGLTSSGSMNQLANAYYTSTDLTLLNAVYSATQNYRPYTHFGSISYVTNGAHNTYHGFTSRIEKRYSTNGLTLNALFAWTKTLSGTAGDGWQYTNWRLTKGPSSTDTRHKFAFQPTYDLPVGKGRKLLTNGGWLNHVIGGWNVQVMAGVVSGPPVTFGMSGSPNRYLSGGPSRPLQLVPDDRVRVADWTMGPSRFPQGAQNPFYKISAFAYPAQFTRSALGSGTQRGRWTMATQWTLLKSWRVAERYKFSLRLDGNNIPVRFMTTTPNTTVNLSSPESFGKFGIQSGMNFDQVGQLNGQLILGGRFEF